MLGRLSAYVDPATRFLNAFSLVLLLIVVVPATPDAANWFDRPQMADNGNAATDEKPDIYLVLLDGYPRADELVARFGFDNTDFIGALRDPGFDVDPQSQSNYPNTQLTLISLFSGEYLGESGVVLDRRDAHDRLHEAVLSGIGTRLIWEAGYDLVTTAPGWEDVTLRSGVDRHIDRPEITDLERYILRRTWLPDLPVMPSNYYAEDLRNRVIGVLDDAVHLAQQPHKPMFAFIHVPAPHLPLAFAPDGGPADVPARRYDLRQAIRQWPERRAIRCCLHAESPGVERRCPQRSRPHHR